MTSWDITGDTTTGPQVGIGAFTGGSTNKAKPEDYKPLIIGAVVMLIVYVVAKKARVI